MAAITRLSVAVVLLGGCRALEPVSLGALRPAESVRAVYHSTQRDSVLTRVLLRQVNGSIEVAATANLTSLRIRLVDLERLQVIRGRARPTGGLVGATAGGAAGIVIGMLCQAQCPENEKGKRYLAPIVGFAVGAPIGAVVGAILAPVRWVDVRLR